MESEGWHSPDRQSPSPHRARTPVLPHSSRSPGPQVRYGYGYKPRINPGEAGADQSLKLRDDLSKMQLNVVRSKQERQSVQQDVDALKLHLHEHKQEIKSSEKQVKEHRSKAEDARSELMLVEFKRDSARRDVERLQGELRKKKVELEQFADGEEETTDANTSTDASRLRDLKLSRVEVAKMLSEKDNLETELKKRESAVRERQELEKQVTMAKEALIKEQKHARQLEEKYKEELEGLETKLVELCGERDGAQRQLSRLEERARQADVDREDAVRRVRAELGDQCARVQEELAQAKHDGAQELGDVRRQLADASARLTKTVAENDESNMKLREQVVTLQTRISEEAESRVALKEEAQEQHKLLVQQKEREVEAQKKKGEEQRLRSLDQLSEELERQNQQILNQAEHRFTQELTDLQSQLTARELELEVLRDRLKQQEAMGRQLADKIRSEANIRFRQLVQEERLKWDVEKEAEIDRQLGSMRDEMEKTNRQLREELTAERQLVESQLKQIGQLKKELESVKSHNRQVMREKLAAVSHAKESADFQSEKQMDRIRERVEEETHRSMEQLRDTIRHNDAQISSLKTENKELKTREQEMSTSSDAQDRILLNEINDECRKIAAVMGATPRVVTFTSFSSTHSSLNKSSKMPIKAAIATALTNLKSSNEDLRTFLKETKQDLDSQKQNLKSAEIARKDSLDVMKQKMQKEKLQALETLKDRLIKEHLDEVDKLHKSLGKGKTMHKALRQKDSELHEIQLNMKKWKNQTTEKLANQFQEEMAHQMEKRLKEYKKQQRDWEREKQMQQREVERLEKELSSHSRTSALNLSTGSTKQNHVFGSPMKAFAPAGNSELAHSVRHLQGKVKQLQAENLAMKRNKLSLSTPDLQAALHSASFSEPPRKDDYTVRQLELQVQRAENRAKMAEERVEKNETLLNHKLLEMSKLQSALTQQTKELMQVERAYSQLQQKATRPPSRTGLQR